MLLTELSIIRPPFPSSLFFLFASKHQLGRLMFLTAPPPRAHFPLLIIMHRCNSKSLIITSETQEKCLSSKRVACCDYRGLLFVPLGAALTKPDKGNMIQAPLLWQSQTPRQRSEPFIMPASQKVNQCFVTCCEGFCIFILMWMKLLWTVRIICQWVFRNPDTHMQGI